MEKVHRHQQFYVRELVDRNSDFHVVVYDITSQPPTYIPYHYRLIACVSRSI